jgi:zinc transport system substrate-binding protein
MILMWRSILAASAAMTLLLTGCAADDEASGNGASTDTAAAFYPLGWLAEQLGGDVELLTSPGVEPHDLELSPQQVAQVADADVVLLLGGFQPAVDEAVEQQAGGEVVDVAEVVDLVADDPHFWQDPMRMAAAARAIGDAYLETDPDQADDIEKATDRLVADLKQLDTEFRQGLADCRTTTVVTSHDAFGYLGESYGLELLPIAGLDPGADPSPQRLAELADLVRDRGVTTIFTETLVSPAVAETLADEAGVSVATLDPIEGLTDETADEDYLSLMRANLSALQEANGC